MSRYKPKLCVLCEEIYSPAGMRQKYCGSIREKSGCSWKMVKIRTFIKNRKPDGIKKRYILTQRWQKEQRAKNTESGEKLRKYHREYRKFKGKDIVKRSELKNKKTINECKRRFILRRKSVDGSHSLIEWNDLKLKFNNLCAICNESKKLTRDHIVPISKGGTDYISNIQPLCQSCNSRKGDRIYA